MKREYNVPKIHSVKLDPGQTILTVCAQGGLYAGGPTTSPFFCEYAVTTGGVTTRFCPSSYKGLQSTHTTRGAITSYAVPS